MKERKISRRLQRNVVTEQALAELLNAVERLGKDEGLRGHLGVEHALDLARKYRKVLYEQ